MLQSKSCGRKRRGKLHSHERYRYPTVMAGCAAMNPGKVSGRYSFPLKTGASLSFPANSGHTIRGNGENTDNFNNCGVSYGKCKGSPESTNTDGDALVQQRSRHSGIPSRTQVDLTGFDFTPNFRSSSVPSFFPTSIPRTGNF